MKKFSKHISVLCENHQHVFKCLTAVPFHCFAPESTIMTKSKALTCIKQVLLRKREGKKDK